MQSDEQEIRQLVATWRAATKAGDIETVLSLMAEDVVFLRPGHPPMIGKLAFAAAAKPPPGQKPPQFDGTSEIQEIKVLGEWAFMWANLTVVATPPGGCSIEDARGTYTFHPKVTAMANLQLFCAEYHLFRKSCQGSQTAVDFRLPQRLSYVNSFSNTNGDCRLDPWEGQCRFWSSRATI